MYEDFARKLQTEIEEECGVEFKDRIANKRDRRKAQLVAGGAQPGFSGPLGENRAQDPLLR